VKLGDVAGVKNQLFSWYFNYPQGMSKVNITSKVIQRYNNNTSRDNSLNSPCAN